MVPTAITRLPRARMALRRSAVSRQHGMLDPGLAKFGHQPVGEMQRCGGCSHGTVLLGEAGLVILAIGLVDLALARDIGRQWHCACPLEQDLDGLVALKFEHDRAVIRLALDPGHHARAEMHDIALAQSFGVAHERLPAAQIDPLVQRRADARLAAQLHPLELRRDDAGIVEHQAVARVQQAWQIAHRRIGHAAALHVQHFRRIARARRAQGDPFLGKVEVEFVNAHRRVQSIQQGSSSPRRRGSRFPVQRQVPGGIPAFAGMTMDCKIA